MRSDEDTVEESGVSTKDKTLYFCGEVGARLWSAVWGNLHGTEGHTFYLNSMGGGVETMLSILDLFDSIDDLTTVATGACMSAAVPLIAAGTPGQRFATPRTRFMIHPIRDESEAGDEVNMETALSEMRRVRELYVDILVGTTKKSLAWWNERLRHKPWYFGVKEAKSVGIIDRVI